MHLSTSPDRVKTPLRIDLPRIGTLRPRSVAEVGPSNWTLGCETLDRDFADWDKYRDYLAPLGIRNIRLQAGWAKCEKAVFTPSRAKTPSFPPASSATSTYRCMTRRACWPSVPWS